MTKGEGQEQESSEEAAYRAETRRRAESQVKVEGARQHRRRDIRAILIFAVFLVLLLGVPGYLHWRKHSVSAARGVAQALIEEWQKGESGAEFWDYGTKPFILFSVSDYKHVAADTGEGIDGKWVRHRFRIKSSTKGGARIELLWDIELQDDEEGWKVVDVRRTQ